MRMLINSLFLFTFLLISPCLLAESDEESGHEDQKSYLLYDHIYLNSEKKESWGQRPRSYSSVIIPVLSAEDDNDEVDGFNGHVKDFVQSERAKFKTEIENNLETQKSLPAKLQKNNLYIDYASAFVRSKHNRVFSVRFSVQQYIGGMAHPALSHYTMNYDLSNGTMIDLASLFKPDSNFLIVLSGVVNDALSKKLKDNFIKEGIQPVMENFDHWNIKSDGILFTFDEGQVAPRVYGAQTVLVPYRSIPGLLSEDTVISKCANKKSRCLASSLLTGGFLDEANITSSARKTQDAIHAV